jgi:hypothetical protein
MILGVFVPTTLDGVIAAVATGYGIALVGALGSKTGGTRRMLYLAPAIGLAAGLGAFTAYDWWWAGLLAAAGVVAGAGPAGSEPLLSSRAGGSAPLSRPSWRSCSGRSWMAQRRSA